MRAYTVLHYTTQHSSGTLDKNERKTRPVPTSGDAYRIDLSPFSSLLAAASSSSLVYGKGRGKRERGRGEDITICSSRAQSTGAGDVNNTSASPKSLHWEKRGGGGGRWWCAYCHWPLQLRPEKWTESRALLFPLTIEITSTLLTADFTYLFPAVTSHSHRLHTRHK